jgi:trk system potassium uptake protein TrkA
LEDAVSTRVAFIMRFGEGILPDHNTVIQAEDTVYVSALSGTITDVTAAARRAPEESD